MALPIPMAVNAIFLPTTPKHKNSEVTIWCGNYQYVPQTATWLLWVWNLIMVDWKQIEGEKVEMATLSRRNQWWSSGEGKILANLLRKMPLVSGSYSLGLFLISLAAELDSSLQIKTQLALTRLHRKPTPLCILLLDLFWHLGSWLNPCTSLAQKYEEASPGTTIPMREGS